MNTSKLSHGWHVNRYSIRWQLPLSYAGIALLAAVALGGLLLFTLRNYYEQREQAYLEESAISLAGQVVKMYSDDLPEDMVQAAINLYSFLVQARIRVLDEERTAIVDSGSSPSEELVTVNFWNKPDSGEPPPPGAESMEPYFIVQREEPPEHDPLLSPEQFPGYLLRTGRGPFGRLLDASTKPGEHSNQTVMVHLRTRTGEEYGYLELSEGPAFGREIVADVAEKAAVAGAIAILLAAVAGWVVSHSISTPVLALADVTAQMAEGDLTVRADLVRRDEFGLLAHTFNTMAARVEHTVTTLKRFAADAAHEINTPITALQMNLQLAAKAENTADFRSDLEHAQAELKRLETLTHSLLTLARLEADGVESEHNLFDLAVLIRQIYEQYASRAEQAGITLDLDTSLESVMIIGDESQLTRMLENLLDNALKFTPADGNVTLSLDMDPDQVYLRVADTGIGIPPDDLPKLFSRFHRGRNASAYLGNGLGLVITKAIVADHNGSIAVESNGKGTCFVVNLPRCVTGKIG
ncbi:MAG: HAMP domain-containing histidine kinase [Anaerolineae bacterium]|nr:HAMP domain-containing histidine kinase [Anaerolineae bacterium]